MPMSIRHRLITTFAAIAFALGLVMASASTAGAAPSPYPPPTSAGPSISIAFDSPLVTGSPITITITGFQPFESITLVIFSDPINLGTFTADGEGTLTTTVTVPAGLEPGAHTIVATGSEGSVAQYGITLAGGLAFTGPGEGSGGGGSGLAFTGIAIGGSLILAIGLLTAGAVTLMAGRRKASSS